MSVHMVRIFVKRPKGEAENAVNNWVENYREWDNDPVDHSMTETTAGIDGSGTAYIRGDYRFIDQGEDPANILQNLSDRLRSFQGGLWHRLAYHVCTHDEEQAHACSWDEKMEYGTIPNDIPTIEVTA